MDSNTSFMFGDFNEKERRLYFSDESVYGSSAIQFPKDVLAFCYVDGHVKLSIGDFGSPAPPVEERDDDFVKENESSYVNDSCELEIGTDSNQETTTPDSHQVITSDKYELMNAINVPDSKSTTDVEISLPNGGSQAQDKDTSIECNSKVNNVMEEEIPSSVTDQKLPEKSPENATNVTTVNTKTTLATSTRTVEPSHSPVSLWADLFKPKSSSQSHNAIPTASNSTPPKHLSLEQLDNGALSGKDQYQHYFLDVLKTAGLTNQVPQLQPRGLKNNGNWCYINAILQVLILSPSFYHFLIKFKLNVKRGHSSTPILDALVLFASQFSKMPPRTAGSKSQDGGKQEVTMGVAFEPTYVYNLLTCVKTTFSQQGKQEDAEEFLSFILNGMHEEMVMLSEIEKKTQPDVTSNHSAITAEAKEGVGEWEQVGPRNKSTITRKSTMAQSPVAEIFGGYLRSSLVKPGVKESASIQPFFSIQLDLRGEVTTVQQAFDNFFRVEEVEGFQCDKSNVAVEVSKKWTLDSLPAVLILHLKRFVVNKCGCEKLTKKISYESELRIPQDTLSKVIKIRNKNSLTYKLFAITYHHGKNLYGGHYTSDISHPAIGWLRADDMVVRTIPTKFVFNPLSNRDPYLLYFKRGDLCT